MESWLNNRIDMWYGNLKSWINCMNMPNVPKPIKLPNCWLNMEFLMIYELNETFRMIMTWELWTKGVNSTIGYNMPKMNELPNLG